ncbi:unnamed protein product [Candidula unifasciata]|uniref:Ig-like domain-containing protein n=1 Tax=Candidula unifasciata TaxID=100452 RepID=A0A8S3YG45_9EUPU|nr:unnamed protein product [Candidula unifasciata]
MSKPWHPSARVLLVLLAFVCLLSAVHCTLTVTPWEQSARLGSDAQFICSDDGNETKAMFLTWSFVVATDNNTNRPIPSTGLIQAVNGTLRLSNVTYQDAGTYKCSNDARSEPATGVLIVYVMPDYLKEGLVIAGISVFLLIVVLIGTGVMIFGQVKVKKARLSEQEKRLLKKANNLHT